MSDKSAARRLQQTTGAKYQQCLNAVRASKTGARRVKQEQPHLTWTDAYCLAALPLLEGDKP